ncbi:hypothetical protein [Taibaiella chishuiensis]|uniref:Uncharacterized protein n=1 Tax=Taibaiella chishuiensis TaxID=1434707 RepID=A0A2P8CYQ0_9BACT|nr:hypothetical protein [Taibaiella chishuiensis]PSK90099.1 hypothetical protein B0I18_109105 [Taibaiella chishuiensis]
MITSFKKTIQALLPLLILTAATTATMAQKCRYDVDKTDAFSKEQLRSTTLKIGPQTIDTRKNREVGWTMTFEQKGGNRFIAFKVIMLGKRDDVVQQGQQAYLRLANDKIIILTAETDVLPSYMTGLAVYTHYDLRFKTDAAAITALSESPATDFKLETGSREIAAELGKKGEKIMETAACFR